MTIRKQLTTFAAIGVLNTAIDITIYTLLIWLTVPLLLAVIISTTTGMICSYFLNRRFTFKTDRQPIVQFIGITLTGLWVLQSTAIWLLIQLFGITSTFGLSIAKFLIRKVLEFTQIYNLYNIQEDLGYQSLPNLRRSWYNLSHIDQRRGYDPKK
jgi:hypothetical protein cdiviTM7_02105